MNSGYVILAQNTETTDYVKCSEALALSLKRTMPNCHITLISNNITKSKYIDKIVKLPYGDLTGYYNDWQVYEASPYEYTIKLEADLYIPISINYWWDVLKQRDLVISTTIRNFKQEISNVRGYRRFVDDNNLPDTYNAITYFRKSILAEQFFKLVKNIFENWDDYKSNFKCNIDEKPTTDFVYSIASHIIGVEKTTLPQFKAMSMVHMKQFINGLPTENWTDTLVYEILPHTLRINTMPQLYPFHYYNKTFADKILKALS